MKEGTIRRTITLKKEVLKAIKIIAVDKDISEQKVINDILEESLKDKVKFEI